MKKKGIWFYGLSGVGKSYISNVLQHNLKNSIIVDGDMVRKYISFDLKYKKSDREIQVKRVFGIAKIITKSGMYPIISTVWMNNEILKMCKKENIEVCLVERDMKKIIEQHKTYKNKKDVVGINLIYDKMKTIKIINSIDKSPWIQLKKLI